MIKFIILLVLFSGSFQKQFLCSKVYRSDYVLFFLRSEPEVFKITSKEHGTIEWGCTEIPIPEFCGVKGTANFIHHRNSAPCLILKDPKVSFGNLQGDLQQKNMHVEMTLEGTQFSENPVENARIEIKMDIWEGERTEIAHEIVKELVPIPADNSANAFTYDDGLVKRFVVELRPQKQSFFKLSFLQALNDHFMITASIFLIFGFILCFFGLKFYQDMLGFFIPLIMVSLGFYLYMAIVEKNAEENNRLVLILITLFCLAVFVALAVTFTNLIYIGVSLLASYQLGILLSKMLSQKLEFFTRENTEYIPIVAVFVMFMVMFYYVKDYFIICCTSLIGAFMIVVGLGYSKLVDADILLDLDFGKWNNMDDLDETTRNIATVFTLTVVLGVMIQIVLFKRERSSSHNDGLRIELKHV